MITEGKGSLFDCGAEALVNPVNCVGVSGKGLAKVFKVKFPASYKRYATMCRTKQLRLGRVFVDGPLESERAKYVIYLPTKLHWMNDSRVVDIAGGLVAMVNACKIIKPKSVAIPALGCGLGGLDWEVVEPMIRTACGPVDDVNWIVFPPKEQMVGALIFGK